MNYLTDLLVLGCSLCFFYSGWQKGLFRTLLNPISLVLGSIIALIYYNNTHDFLISLLIGIISPLLIHIIFLYLLKLVAKPWDKNQPGFSITRLWAGLISMLWSDSLLFLTLLFIALVPVKSTPFNRIQDNVTSSLTYKLVNQLTGDRLPTKSRNLEKMTQMLDDPDKVEAIRANPKFQEVLSDQRMADLFSDETTIQQIQNKNIMQLMSKPKIQAVMQDEELIKKLIELQQEMLKQAGTESGNTEKKSHPQPKVIEVQ